MTHVLPHLLKSAAVTFLIVMLLALSPLWPVAGVAWVAFQDIRLFLLLLLFLGIPFGGFVFFLVTTPKSDRSKTLAKLTGFWLGAIGGVTTGMAIRESFKWT